MRRLALALLLAVVAGCHVHLVTIVSEQREPAPTTQPAGHDGWFDWLTRDFR